jgi:phytoene dehydrogenase-like protein
MVAAHIMPANYAPLTQPGASLAMLHHAVGEIAGRKGAWGIVRGGMGAITRPWPMRRANGAWRSHRGRGGEDRNHLRRGQRRAPRGRRAPRRAGGGGEHGSEAHLLKLLGAEHLPGGLRPRYPAAFRQESASLRMNLALSGLPSLRRFPAPTRAAALRQHHPDREARRISNQAYQSARAGMPADPPIIEAIIPSAAWTRNSRTTPGHHVMSLLCKYMPYDLADGAALGRAEGTARGRAYPRPRGALHPQPARHPRRHQCHTPLDLERDLGMTRGDICHGRLEPDQLFSMRPHPQAAQYATPVPGLYLCGSGAHPGGGVTGAPGHNAARRILRDRRR